MTEKENLRKKLGLAPGSKVLAYVGRITVEKGIVELIEAFKSLISSGYNTDLILVGPMDSDCGGNSTITKNRLTHVDRIHYVGYDSKPEKYMAISDVFCIPSYREGFGTTVIEAASMGIPTIGTRINGLVDAVCDGETGILVKPKDVKSLVSALKKLLDNPALMAQMGTAARQRCETHFDKNRISKMVAQRYFSKISNV